MKPYRAAPFAVAPLMDWTDRHCRFFHRILTRRALLYTEMVTTGAVIHGDRKRLIGFSPEEHPVALQLGGSDPVELAAAARIGADFGYDEINLNVGCPSDRVQNGRFGACLMREPSLVADCVAAMKAAVAIPVTVKCRIGVDDQDPEEALCTLTRGLVAVGVDGLVVHARKAWLQGLSPKENREIPPLDYGRVHRLKRSWPDLPIALNGGLADVEAGLAAIGGEDIKLDGMMLGRAAYQNPEILMAVDPLLYGEPAPVSSAEEAIDAFIPYVEARLAEGYRLNQMTRHLLGLFPGRPGARLYRRHLATEAVKPGAGVDVLRAAVAHVTEASARQVERAALESAV
ncbi:MULTISPECIES: tRNA dihydrouridine(20/20a) synthase DusA [unclassified Chelatococcus]|uniref:tRNA dihydrouridine(20/20a) synthase DusA n=1 Tax=unclassified Chelatococcus TaxID=2638111 RepID=UPI001BCB9446|nr:MULTISPECIES: tRNA dihydrouridine(20/20a) synthase DusA [unclassified Chelatococcus]MBS7739262.1 tRNA dihydrouridine(20/20a) synthase DusA [Chelatococcus sp. HY11]MBX3546541.1 tRNA dihydrouridine(20/20a) synthase DusA [Chelatococcus sp.]MCO5076205.1 tRNA dihydrouridine(20/20a) synthase DusA [Chelatococcus sp.]